MADFGITIVARAKHRALREATKKFGGTIKEFADHLGTNTRNIYDWLSLRSAPPLTANCYWPQEKIDALESKLITLTGQTLEQLFPQELRSAEFRESVRGTREIHKDIDLQRLGQYRPDVLALPSPEEVIQKEDLTARIAKAIERLSHRQRTVIRLRFGIGGDKTTHTLEETGAVLKVSKERVRQIEIRALRSLRFMDTELADFLRQAVPDEWTEPKRNFRKLDNRPDVSLKERYAEACP